MPLIVNQNPSPIYIEAADQLLKYLVSTKYLAIEYDRRSSDPRVCLYYTDASLADDKLTRRSSYGLNITLYKGQICYKAVKQESVAILSTHSELLGASIAARELI
jgi:hypothetical protein